MAGARLQPVPRHVSDSQSSGLPTPQPRVAASSHAKGSFSVPTPNELISGTCQQLLFSPKGGIKGAVLRVKGAVLQLSMHPDTGAAFARSTGPGKRLRVLADADHSPKTKDGAHPVYLFEAFSDAQGHAVDLAGSDPANTLINGTVAERHYARHGQPNGAVLETGEFFHMRPHGMTQIGLGVGAKVSAVGEVRMTVLGTRMQGAFGQPNEPGLRQTHAAVAGHRVPCWTTRCQGLP